MRAQHHDACRMIFLLLLDALPIMKGQRRSTRNRSSFSLFQSFFRFGSIAALGQFFAVV